MPRLEPEQQYANLRALIAKEHGENIALLVDRYMETGFKDKARIPFNPEAMIFNRGRVEPD